MQTEPRNFTQLKVAWIQEYQWVFEMIWLMWRGRRASRGHWSSQQQGDCRLVKPFTIVNYPPAKGTMLKLLLPYCLEYTACVWKSEANVGNLFGCSLPFLSSFFLCKWVLPVCLSVYRMHSEFWKARRGSQVSRDWKYRELYSPYRY